MDYTPHVFKSSDGGVTWNDISSNLPSIPANDIIIAEINNLPVLFLATDLNVWYSENDGVSWSILGTNLPLTVIRDLKYHEPTAILYAGTYGRSMHSIDVSNLILSTEDFDITNNELKIYPIPANDQINISHRLDGTGSIDLFDTSGRKVQILFSGNLTPNTEKRVSLPNLSSGLYIVKVKNEKRSISKKILIK